MEEEENIYIDGGGGAREKTDNPYGDWPPWALTFDDKAERMC